MTVIRFPIGHERPPLSLNDRMHWGRKAKIVAELRGTCRLLTEQAMKRNKKPLRLPLRVSLVWVVTDRRERDHDNRMATLKPCIDGVADALGISDKHTNIVPWVRIERGAERGVFIEVVDNASDSVAAMERSEQ